MNVEEIRRIRIETSVAGADTSIATLNKLAAAQDGVAVTGVRVEKETLSVETALNRLRMNIDTTFRSTERMAAAQKTLSLAYNEGLLGITGSSAALAEQNRLLDLAATKYKAASDGSRGMFTSFGAGLGGLGGIRGVATGFGIFELVNELTKIPSRVVDIVHEVSGLGHMADAIGISVKALQELNFAGNQFHISTETMDAALQRFSKNLGLASAGGGELFKILQTNHIKISGDFTKDFLAVADLIEHATNAEQRNAITTSAFGKNAEELGLLFERGAGGIRQAMDEADRIGGVFSDEQIRKIAATDKAFISLATTLSVGFKSAIVDTISGIGTLISRLQDARLATHNWLADNFGTIQLGPPTELDIGDSARALDRMKKQMVELQAELNGPNAQLIGRMKIQLDIADLQKQIDAAIPHVVAATLAVRDPNKFGLDLRGLGSGPGLSTSDHASALPDAAAANLRKQFEDATKAIEKQTVALRAEAGALGMGVGPAAAYVKEQELLALAETNHLKLGPAEIANVDKIAAAFGRATEALAKAKIAADIKWTRGTMFLSAEDVKIANALRALYGDDIPTALHSTEAAAMRMTDALGFVRDQTINALGTLTDDLLAGKDAWDSLSDAARNFGRELIRMAENQLVNNLFQNLIGAFLGGGAGVSLGHGGLSLGGGHGGLSPMNDNRVMNLPRSRSPAPAASGGGGLSITVPITMAPGASNEQIAKAGAVAIKEALDGFKRELPDRVHAIAANPRRR